MFVLVVVLYILVGWLVGYNESNSRDESISSDIPQNSAQLIIIKQRLVCSELVGSIGSFLHYYWLVG